MTFPAVASGMEPRRSVFDLGIGGYSILFAEYYLTWFNHATYPMFWILYKTYSPLGKGLPLRVDACWENCPWVRIVEDLGSGQDLGVLATR